MNNKKVIKLIGNIITIAVIFFIIKRLLNYEISWSIFFIPKNLLILFIMIIAYGFNVIFICIPWKNILEILTSVKIKFSMIALVYCKANILKYVPGNIFQYIGRNEIVFKMNLNHLDVGISTVFDVIINVVAITFVSVILYFPGIQIWLNTFGLLSFRFIIIAILIVISLAIIAVFIFKDKMLCYIREFKVFLNPESLKKVLLSIVHYSLQGAFTAVIYIILLINVIGVNVALNQLNIIIGAFLLSWLAGFLMIGAPAGIGIREATMTLLTVNVINSESVLLSMVIYRIITTLGDVVALLIAKIINLKNNNIDNT